MKTFKNIAIVILIGLSNQLFSQKNVEFIKDNFPENKKEMNPVETQRRRATTLRRQRVSIAGIAARATRSVDRACNVVPETAEEDDEAPSCCC